jgi:glycosyltransferase involved in cell wall biosynthesis
MAGRRDSRVEYGTRPSGDHLRTRVSREHLADPLRTTRVTMAMLTFVPSGMGGSERYARSLVRELARDPALDLQLLVAASARGFAARVPEEVVDAIPGRDETTARIAAIARARLGGRSMVSVRRADVLHHPFSVPVPTSRRARTVQTLHDVQHHDLPQLFSRAELLYRKLTYDRGARRADAVVTISDFAKQRAVSVLGLDPQRVHVAHLGVDVPDTAPRAGERQDFVLYPARAWPHKNHARLVAAMDLVRRSRPSLRLVLTGGGLDGLGALPSWVEHRGHVSDAELVDLYESASCLAFPSLYEGFGLPPLEAMAHSCPVAASSAAAVPEVCGDAAVLFDPTDVTAIAAGLERAIDGRDRLVPLGHQRVRQFTWAACAEVHSRLYRRLHRPSGP